MSIFNYVPPNAVVTLQKLSVTTVSGGKVRAWATRTAGIQCLITQQSPDGMAAERHTVTFDTRDTLAAELGVGDRLLVTAAADGPLHLVGLYLSLDGLSRHGAADVDPFTRCATTQRLESWTPS